MENQNGTDSRKLGREQEYAYWLSCVEGIGAVKAGCLRQKAGSFEEIYNMKKEQLEQCGFLHAVDKKNLWEARKLLEKRREEACHMCEKGIRLLLTEDEEYPERLRNIYDCPQWLFVRGNIPDKDTKTVAIVGARSCTSYGSQEAERLGRVLSEAGVAVISGLALGVDGSAHRGAIRGGGETYAVLGCGIDVCYPPSHHNLYQEVLRCGGILSEYGPGEAPVSTRFPVRNRIISGLSDAVIVVEARKRSGSLITADLALEQGKEVFALPGRRTDPLSAGCNRLIGQGAAILTEEDEVLDFFRIKCKKSGKAEKKSVNGLAKTEKMVYSCLDSHPRHLEEIMNLCSLSVGDCMTALLTLELNGWIIQPVNHHYARKLE
ncbi:MAG: DNA-processing protein DprA [Clostridium sp.]|nr:DNA-processing protein DprA [Clostridium sp.]